MGEEKDKIMQTKWGKYMNYYKIISKNLICFSLVLSLGNNMIFFTAPFSIFG